MRHLFFALTILAVSGFAASELSAQQQRGKGGKRKGAQSGQQGGKGARKGGGQKGAGQRGQSSQRGGGGSRLMEMMPLYVALDKNKDGKLSREEIANAVAAIRTLDKNRNGVIDTGEMAPDMSKMRAQRSQNQGNGAPSDKGMRRGGKSGGKGKGKAGGKNRDGEDTTEVPGGTKPKRPGSN